MINPLTVCFERGARMSSRLLLKHKFKGKRFDDNGIDIDVLPELLVFKRILVETTKALWRKNNPERDKLPGNFEASISLKFYEIESGSVSIPIHLVQNKTDEDFLPGIPMPDLIDDAVDIFADACESSAIDHSLPENFPKSIIPLFHDYGKTLKDDESFEYEITNRDIPVSYTIKSREYFSRLTEQRYEDSVEISGVVTMASVRRNRVGITLNNNKEIEASFEQGDEEAIISALKNHKTAKLRVIGKGQFSIKGQLEKIISVDKFELLQTGERPFDKNAKPIWDVFDEIMSDVSEDTLNALPHDGALEHDHYIYSIPKKRKTEK